MAQLPEILASAYTPEMDTLGAIPDILVFEVRHDTDVMRGFQSEIFDRRLCFLGLIRPPMRSKVIVAGFGDYAAGLRWTQPRFPPAMRYALMERWNDCTHSFIFGFREMTLTPADYTAITRLRFDGEVSPLDSRYQTAALGAELVRTLLGVPTRCRYTAPGYVSYEVVYKFWAERLRTRLAAWRELPADARPAAPAYTREERDQAACHVGSYDWASLALAHLYHGLDVWTRGSGESNWQFLRPLKVWAYEYRIYPGGLGSDTSVDAQWIPRYLVHRHHTFSGFEDPHYWRCYLNDRALADVSTGNHLIPSVSVGGRCLGGLSSSCLSGGCYPVQDFAARLLGERVFELHVATAQRRVPAAPPRHMCILEGMTPEDLLLEYDGHPANVYLTAGDYASTTWLQARLPEIREYSQERRRHRTPAYYRAQVEAEVLARPAGVVLGDVPFPPGMEVALDPGLGLRLAIIIPVDLRQARPPLQLDPEHATHDLEIGTLRRHQSHQSGAVARLQMEVDRLRTRLEVEGIPLDFSKEDDDDDDGSSSDDALTPPPFSVGQAAAGPGRRRR
ncbi:hypothetical protein JCGZ_25143 [Jatropha curcas]|uniref:Aminotransferase-like plant mobile domain-containing protein n=1 Tax=Jatropha curcas TaxID=180498 RepID=A0A067LHL9_JATCU|nr:hypothetical protein JCGZ_25143 [Jatropha curcas]